MTLIMPTNDNEGDENLLIESIGFKGSIKITQAMIILTNA